MEKDVDEAGEKYNEHIDDIGMQLLLAGIEAMEEYVDGKHVEWNHTAERLAYVDAKVTRVQMLLW